MNYILALLILFSFALCSHSYAQDSAARVLVADYVEGTDAYRNYMVNPGAEKNVTGLTCTGTWTNCTRTTTANAIITGKASYFLNTATIGATASFDSKLWVTNEMKSRNCAISFDYTNGFDANGASQYEAYVTINGVKVTPDYVLQPPNDRTTVRATVPSPEIIFPCGDGSFAPKLVIESLLSTGAAIYIDNIYLGKPKTLSSIAQAVAFGSMTQVGTATCGYVENTSSGLTNYVALGAGTGCNAWTTSGSVSAVGTNDHRPIANNVPPGLLEIKFSGTIQTTAAGSCQFRLSDGTTTYQPQVFGGNSDVRTNVLVFNVPVISAQSSITFQLQAADDHAGACQINNNANLFAHWDFKHFPTQNQTAVSMLQSNFGWESYTPAFSGATPTSVECRRKRQGEDLLVDCKFTMGSRLASEFRVGLGGSLVSAGSPRIPSIRQAGKGTFGVTATSQLTVLIEPSVSYLTFSFMDAGASGLTKVNGNSFSADYAISFQARVPIQGWTENQNAPLLVGGVASGYQGVTRTEWVAFGGSTVDGSDCTTSPCTIWRSSGSAISSVTRTTTGEFNINFASGTWSDKPICIVTNLRTSTSSEFITVDRATLSTTLAKIYVKNIGGSVSDTSLHAICMGAR